MFGEGVVRIRFFSVLRWYRRARFVRGKLTVLSEASTAYVSGRAMDLTLMKSTGSTDPRRADELHTPQSNAGNAPFSAVDAFFVHGTTGLFLPHLERGEYLENVSRAWDLVGL